MIKDKLFAVALFFYIYTNPQESFEQAVNEILSEKSYKDRGRLNFVECSDVKDPLMVFRPEFFSLTDKVKKYYQIALADGAGFEADTEAASVLRKMFFTALELPAEEPIEQAFSSL